MQTKKILYIFILFSFLFIVYTYIIDICIYVGSNLEINEKSRRFATNLIYMKLSYIDNECVSEIVYDRIEGADEIKYLYILRIAGVYGLNEFDEFIKSEIDNRRDEISLDRITSLLRSLGFIGNEKNIKFLKNIKLHGFNNTEKYILNSFIDSALFYSGCDNCDYNFTIDEYQNKTFEIISRSRGRSRTYSEMVFIDSVYR